MVKCDENAKRVIKRVEAFANDNNYVYFRGGTGLSYRITIPVLIGGENRHIIFDASAEYERLSISALLVNEPVPDERRFDAAVAICVLNNIRCPRWQYDVLTGKVSYWAGTSFKGGDVSDETIEYMFITAFNVVENMQGDWRAFLSGELTVEDFVEKYK